MEWKLKVEVAVTPIVIKFDTKGNQSELLLSIQRKVSDIFNAVQIQGERFMETAQSVIDGQAEILATVQAESAEVATKIDAQAALIAQLQEQLANGVGATPEQLQLMADNNAAIKAAVAGIFTAPAVDPVA